MRKQRIISLCLASALALSLAACNSPADEQNSAQPTPSTQPTAAPTPTPTPPIPFTDVAQDSSYYDAVVWAYKNGIASNGETFGPADACTRGQVMTFLWRAKGSPEPQVTESPFSDVSSDDWFYKPALWASENGIATGSAFNPGNPCTNAEALTFLWRAEGKPAASVYNSTVALAASGQYYARPAAWAETNGLFAGTEFDPAAPCSRAGLMAYLYWATEEWTFAEEDKAVQAEYEQIINDAQLFEVHGSGLCYADYVDVDNDGKVELLTLGASGDSNGYYTYEVIATVYSIMDSHAEKICEQTFSWIWQPESLSICTNEDQIYLWSAWEDVGTSSVGDTFFKVENGAFAIGESISVSYASEKPEYSGITETEYNALDQKYTNKKGLLSYNRDSGLSIQNRGLLPSPEEYKAALAEQWETEREKIYAAVKNGDFSFFAGTYELLSGISPANSLVLMNNGSVSGGDSLFETGKKPISVIVAENGAIKCYISKTPSTGTVDWNDGGEEYYEIYPVGVSREYSDNNSLDRVRIYYVWAYGGVGDWEFAKVS